MQVSPINTYTLYANKNSQTPKKSKFEATTFTGKSKLMDKTTDGIAKFIGSYVVNNRVAKFIVEKVKDTNLVSHLSVLTALALSGFYMQQTSKNKDLEKKKRNTLVINQGLVAVVSTVMGYTFDKMANKKVDRYIETFKIANAANPLLKTYVNGIKAAKSMMIFGMMYRFIAPVLVTPLANWIGNKIAEPKKAQINTKA